MKNQKEIWWAWSPNKQKALRKNRKTCPILALQIFVDVGKKRFYEMSGLPELFNAVHLLLLCFVVFLPVLENCSLCLPWITPWNYKFLHLLCILGIFIYHASYLDISLVQSIVMSCLMGILPCICMSVFILYHWSYHRHTLQSCIKMPNFQPLCCWNFINIHQSLYLFHTLKKYTEKIIVNRNTPKLKLATVNTLKTCRI